MIEKRGTCLYCGAKMESKTAKKKFCSDLHRVYYNREKNRSNTNVACIASPDKSISIEKHPLYKNSDPVEGSFAFMMKYNCSNYNELQEILNKKS